MPAMGKRVVFLTKLYRSRYLDRVCKQGARCASGEIEAVSLNLSSRIALQRSFIGLGVSAQFKSVDNHNPHFLSPNLSTSERGQQAKTVNKKGPFINTGRCGRKGRTCRYPIK